MVLVWSVGRYLFCWFPPGRGVSWFWRDAGHQLHYRRVDSGVQAYRRMVIDKRLTQFWQEFITLDALKNLARKAADARSNTGWDGVSLVRHRGYQATYADVHGGGRTVVVAQHQEGAYWVHGWRRKPTYFPSDQTWWGTP